MTRHLAGGWLLVGPDDAPQVARALRLARRVGERDRIAAPASWQQLLAEAEEAELAGSTAAGGSAAVPPEPVLPPSRLDGECTTREAASVIGTGERNVRDLAARGAVAARKVGRAWLLDRADVLRRAAS